MSITRLWHVILIVSLGISFFLPPVSAARSDEPRVETAQADDEGQPAREIISAAGTYTSVSAGHEHTCALTSAGGVRCWGKGENGRLGNSSSSTSRTPVDVTGLSSGVTAIAAGGQHTCALTVSGGVKCWGNNDDGQLGDGTTTRRSSPVDVSGLTSGVTAITAGFAHTCALTSAKAVRCWGDNDSGQLGDGSTTDRRTSVEVATAMRGVAAGTSHTCALTETGEGRCWGSNTGGELGNNSFAPSTTPVTVFGLTNATQISAGGPGLSFSENRTCARQESGDLRCWGDGDRIPTSVNGILVSENVVSVSVGRQHACALLTTGVVKCWGTGSFGKIGNGQTSRSATAAVVAGLPVATVVSAGGDHTCAVVSGGLLFCWGLNSSGQAGTGSPLQRLAPTDLSGPFIDARALALGGASGMDVNHSCLLTVNNGVKCWGADDAGQVGDGANATPRLTPVDVAGLSGGVAQIAASGSQSCALIVGNSVVCWGDFKFVPAPQNGLAADVAAIAGGGSHFCAIINSTSFPGAARCWGRGPLGDGTQNDSSIPVQVSGLTSGVVAIAAYKNGIGNSASCALLSNGSVWCWGENSRGQLGDGTTTDRLTPVLVSGLSSGVTAISAGSNHACALLQSGGVRCWGDNDDGQLGDGTFTDRPTPVDVVGLSSGVVAISAGGDFSDGHTCARLATGALQCWGSNHDGQLGIGGSQFTAQSTPVDVIGLPGAASVVEAGPRHTCAIVSGRVKCWGDNFDGQLGDGTGGYYTTPVPVGVTRKIIPVQGGDLVAPSVTVIIPSGAFTDTVVLTHTLVVDYPAAPNIVLPPAFDIVPGFISGAPAQLEPGKTFTLIATYSEQDLTGLPESGLALYFWNGSQWMKETTSVVDASANTVTATPDHFSIWAVMAEANQSQLRVYLPLIRR